MARKPSGVNGKMQVADAVSTVGRALSALIQSMKDHGEHLSAQDFESAFAHLRATFSALEAQARRDRTLIAASVFSFDAPQMQPSHEPTYRYTSAPMPAQNWSGADDLPNWNNAPPATVRTDVGLVPITPVKAAPISVSDIDLLDDEPDFGSSIPPAPTKENWKKPTGRLSKYSGEADAGKAVHVEMSSPALGDEVADIVSDISFSAV